MFSDLIKRITSHINIIMHSIILVPTLSMGNVQLRCSQLLRCEVRLQLSIVIKNLNVFEYLHGK